MFARAVAALGDARHLSRGDEGTVLQQPAVHLGVGAAREGAREVAPQQPVVRAQHRRLAQPHEALFQHLGVKADGVRILLIVDDLGKVDARGQKSSKIAKMVPGMEQGSSAPPLPPSPSLAD